MPIVEQSDLNWAKLIDDTEEVTDDGFKKVIEFKTEDNKKYKVVNIFRVDKIKVPKSVAERKEWAKFGDSENDPPGINPATTVISDECFMQFLTNKEQDADKNENQAQAPQNVKCRYCQGDHWSAHCPNKDVYMTMMSKQQDQQQQSQDSGSAYRPPSMRSGATTASKTGKTMDPAGSKYKADEYTVRVTNLPEEATEDDLMQLFKPFGKVNRVFLAKDRTTQQSRGFAFVNFQNKDDAQRAILGVNDYGYSHLILKVEWAK